MESAERLLSQLRCGNIVEEDSFSMSILDCPPLTIQMELRECMTEIAGYELPKNWADEALAAYKEAQHG